MDDDNKPDGAPVDDLAHLLSQAEELDGAPQAAQAQAEQKREAVQQQQAAATIADTAAELLSALQMARMMLAPMLGWWADFGRVWGDPTLQGIAQSGAVVMERHGWTMGEVLGQYGPYLALIGATLPPSFVTYQAIKSRREAPDERPQQAAD